MMKKTNNKIKVVKRVERELRQEEETQQRKQLAIERRSEQEKPHKDAVGVITEWIGDLRQKKSAELQAFKKFIRKGRVK
ncbi:MAG: hypothetical protein WKF84_12010 [Pyrinomonadaceae bacterium]